MDEPTPVPAPSPAPVPASPRRPVSPLRAFNAETLSAFKIPAFRLLWINTVTFALAQGTQRFLFVWLVLELLDRGTRSAGAISFALGIPVFFMTIPAGVLSDRVNRRMLIQVSQLGAALVSMAAAIAVWTDVMTMPLAFVLALAIGAMVAIGLPVRNAVVPSIVPRERLMNAIVLMSMAMLFTQIVGPAIGGAAVAFTGIGGAFAVQSVLLLIGVLVLIPLRLETPEAPPEGRNALREARAGFSFVWGHPGIRGLILMLALFGLLWNGPFIALLPDIARDDLGVGAFAASMLFAFMGLGLFIGSTILASLGDFRNKGGWFLVSTLFGGGILVGIGLSPVYAVTAVVLAVGGIAGGFFMNLNQTLVQSNTPAPLMGRVMSIHTLGMAGVGPLGSLVAGALAASIGSREWMVISGLCVMAAGAIMLLTQRDLRTMD